MTFRLVESAVFSERFGLVLVSATLLERLCSSVRGDLLEAFTSTDLGDLVCREGAIVPVLGLAHGDYVVAVRDASPPALTAPHKTSTGWVLEVPDAPLLLCGLGYLANWNPEDARHRRVPVPKGMYSVQFSAGFTAEGDWGIDFLLIQREAKPEFHASLDVPFDVYLDEA